MSPKKLKKEPAEKKNELQTPKKLTRKEAESEDEANPWDKHREAMAIMRYHALTMFGSRRLKKPAPVWLMSKKWTVGMHVSPLEWQILLHADSPNGHSDKYVYETEMRRVFEKKLDPRLSHKVEFRDRVFRTVVRKLKDRDFLQERRETVRSPIVDTWKHPDLTGARAGGPWHVGAIHDFLDLVSDKYLGFAYPDRGLDLRAEIPDAVTVMPSLDHKDCLWSARDRKLYEPHRWDMRDPVYAEFKSKTDIENNFQRFEKQVEKWKGTPLYVKAESEHSKIVETLKSFGRRLVSLDTLFWRRKGDMAHVDAEPKHDMPGQLQEFLENVKEQLELGYDDKARLVKTGDDHAGSTHYSLVMYDETAGHSQSAGSVIPRFAACVDELANCFMGPDALGRFETHDYIYEIEWPPSEEHKTFRWKKKPTKSMKLNRLTRPHASKEE